MDNLLDENDETNDIFGSDSDDEESEETNSTQNNRLTSLFDSSGKRLSQHPASQLSLWSNENSPSPFSSPKFIGPIVLEKSLPDEIGGGRGFIAAIDITPGTLLLSECPIILWKDDLDIADGHGSHGIPFEVRVLQGILSSSLNDKKQLSVQQIIDSMIPLYPEVLSEYADQTIIKEFREDKHFVELINHLPKNEVSLSFDEALRIVLALRSNAFASGLYPHFAMFNHSCMPNCVKYPPLKGQLNAGSEVRAIRNIRKGEPLTVSYLEPREQSRIQRFSQLWGQFRFHCKCELCCNNSLKELILSQQDTETKNIHLPSSSSSSSNTDEIMNDWWEKCEVKSLGVLALRQLIAMAGDDPSLYVNKEQLRSAAMKAQSHLLSSANSPKTTPTVETTPSDKITEVPLSIETSSSSAVTLGIKSSFSPEMASQESALAELAVSDKVENDLYNDIEEYEITFQSIINEEENNIDENNNIFGKEQIIMKNKNKNLKSPKSKLSIAFSQLNRARRIRSRSLRLLPQGHPFHQRCLKYVIDILANIATTLEEVDTTSSSSTTQVVPTTSSNYNMKEQLIEVVQNMLILCLDLKLIQCEFLGNDHPDLGRTHQDISNCIRLLLRISPSCFNSDAFRNGEGAGGGSGVIGPFQLPFPPLNMMSVSAANQIELKERMSHERIRALYSGF